MQAASTANRADASAETDSATTSATAASNGESDLAEASSAVPVDIMDMETQVLDVLPIFRANAAAVPAHDQHNKPDCSTHPAAMPIAQSQHNSLHHPAPLSPNQLHEQHDKRDEAEPLPEGSEHTSLSVQDQQSKSLSSAAKASHAHDHPTSILDPAAKAAADASKATSGMDLLLEAMLAGDL